MRRANKTPMTSKRTFFTRWVRREAHCKCGKCVCGKCGKCVCGKCGKCVCGKCGKCVCGKCGKCVCGKCGMAMGRCKSFAVRAVVID